MGLLGRQPGIAAFTVVEAAGLVAWLALAEGAVAPDVVVRDVAVPAAALGAGLLFVALLVEQALTDLTVNGLRPGSLGLATFVVAATETAVWTAWLLVAEAVGGLAGVAVAGVLLAVLLVPHHAVEASLLRDRDSPGIGLGYWTLPVSVVEALGATALLAVVVDPALFGTVDAMVDFERYWTTGAAGVPPAVASTVDPATLDVLAPTDLDAALAGVGTLVGVLYLEHNLALAFTCRTAAESEETSDAAVPQ